MTTAPETISAVASSIPSVSSSRARSVTRRVSGSRGAQRVAEAADRPDQGLVVGVELAPQIADVRLDHVVVAVEVVLPHVIEYLLLGKHPLGVEQQVAQQPELGGGEADLLAGAPDLVAVLVELEVAVLQPLRIVPRGY